jgi:hypothetical protein
VEETRYQAGKYEPAPSHLSRTNYAHFSLIVLLSSGCTSQATEESFRCALARNEAVYGLSGEWKWANRPNSRRLCLKQTSPVRVRGITEVDGKVQTLSGAVAPSGAVFVTAVPADSSAFTFVAHRQNDSLIVDWLAESGMPDRYGAGVMYREVSKK